MSWKLDPALLPALLFPVIAVCGSIWILYVLYKALLNATGLDRFFVERRTKKLIQRNQDMIDDHLARIRVDAPAGNPRNPTQDCMREIIAKRGGIKVDLEGEPMARRNARGMACLKRPHL